MVICRNDTLTVQGVELNFNNVLIKSKLDRAKVEYNSTFSMIGFNILYLIFFHAFTFRAILVTLFLSASCCHDLVFMKQAYKQSCAVRMTKVNVYIETHFMLAQFQLHHSRQPRLANEFMCVTGCCSRQYLISISWISFIKQHCAYKSDCMRQTGNCCMLLVAGSVYAQINRICSFMGRQTDRSVQYHSLLSSPLVRPFGFLLVHFTPSLYRRNDCCICSVNEPYKLTLHSL